MLLPLPAAAYEACDKRPGRVTSLSLVRYRTNDYSAPTEYGHRQVLIKGYVNEVEDFEEKLALDIYYLKYRSTVMDFLILWKTAKTVLLMSGV